MTYRNVQNTLVLIIGLLLYVGFYLVTRFLIGSSISFSIISVPIIVIPTIIYFVVLRFFARHEVGDLQKILIRVCYLVSVGLFVYIIGVLSVNEYNSLYTKEKWMNQPEKRILMVDDVLSDYDLKGKTKQEVFELLGDATDADYFKSSSNIVYYLGPEPGLISIDSAWLVFKLDKNYKVSSYQIKTD